MDESKQRALKDALSSIEKQFGKGAVMRLEDGKNPGVEVSVIPSGSISLDVALGIGGYPRGRIIEIYGPESSGKTTLTLHAIAEAQKQGGVAAFIDAEHALDVNYAKKLGVNVDELLISQPDHGEQALEIADMLVRSNAVDLIVIDSVAALVPKAEIEGDMGDQLPGLQARLMSQALRKLAAAVHKTNAMVIFINQLRMKIGVMFGNPETTTGGNALKFYASVRLDVRRVQAIKGSEKGEKEERAVGNRTRVKVVKNKMAAPFREVEFDIMYGQGVSRAGDLLDLATEQGLVEKSGAWMTVCGQRVQGRDAAKSFLEQNPDAYNKLHNELLTKNGLKKPVPAAGAKEKEEKETPPTPAERRKAAAQA